MIKHGLHSMAGLIVFILTALSAAIFVDSAAQNGATSRNSSFVVDLPYPSHFLYSLQRFNLSFPFYVNVSDQATKPQNLSTLSPKQLVESGDSFLPNKSVQNRNADTRRRRKPSRFGLRESATRILASEVSIQRDKADRSLNLSTTTSQTIPQAPPFRQFSSKRLAIKRGYRLPNGTETVKVVSIIPKINFRTNQSPKPSIIANYSAGYTNSTSTSVEPVEPFDAVSTNKELREESGVGSLPTERLPRSQSILFTSNQLDKASAQLSTPDFSILSQKFLENTSSLPVFRQESNNTSSFPDKSLDSFIATTKVLTQSSYSETAGKLFSSLQIPSVLPNNRTDLPTGTEEPVNEKLLTPTQLPKPEIPQFPTLPPFYATTEVVEVKTLTTEVPTSQEETSTELSSSSLEDLIRKFIGSDTVTGPTPVETTLEVSASSKAITTTDVKSPEPTTTPATPSSTSSKPLSVSLPDTTTIHPETQATTTEVVKSENPLSTTSSPTPLPAVSDFEKLLSAVSSFPVTQNAANPTDSGKLFQANTTPNVPSAANLFNLQSFSSTPFSNAAPDFRNSLGNVTGLSTFNQQFPGISVFEALVSIQGGNSQVNPSTAQPVATQNSAGAQQFGNSLPSSLSFGTSAQNPYLVSGFNTASDISAVGFNTQAIPFGSNFGSAAGFQQFPQQQQVLGNLGQLQFFDLGSFGQSPQTSPSFLLQALTQPQQIQSLFPGQLPQNLGALLNNPQHGTLSAGLPTSLGSSNTQLPSLPGQALNIVGGPSVAALNLPATSTAEQSTASSTPTASS